MTTAVAIRTDITIRCHHGIALVGGFDTHPEVQHDGTGMFPGESLACDDEQAKARKQEQAAEMLRQERVHSAARSAGRRSMSAEPMSYAQRLETYRRPNPTGQLTHAQRRRLTKKAARNGYGAIRVGE